MLRKIGKWVEELLDELLSAASRGFEASNTHEFGGPHHPFNRKGD